MELSTTIQAVQIEAARSLVDIAKQAIWTSAANIFGYRMQSRYGMKMVLCYKLGSPLN
jgi:hypothetical protein